MLVADDASAMRKARGQKAKAGPKDANWSTEVLDDGTLEIIGYKGKDTTVVIPAEIGGILVSSLCGHCLSPEKERLKNEGREDLDEEIKWVSQELGDGLGYDIKSYQKIDNEYQEIATTYH